jgi:signal transduction histidine kinase
MEKSSVAKMLLIRARSSRRDNRRPSPPPPISSCQGTPHLNDTAPDVRRLLRQQQALAAFGSFALRQNDLMTVLAEAARVCADGLDSPFSKICRYRDTEDDLLIEAGCGWQSGVIGNVVSRADQTSPQGRAFITGEPSICYDLHQDHGFELPAFYAAHGIRSTIDVIIKGCDNEPYGVLEIDSDVQKSYDENDIQFLTGFANVLAEAVATAARTATLQATIAEMATLAREKDVLLAQKQALADDLRSFAHIASHDLKAPVRAISHLAGWIEDDLGSNIAKETAEHLRLMQKRAGRLQQLLEGLLSYTRIGHDGSQPERVDLAEKVQEIASSLTLPPGFSVAFEGPTLSITAVSVPLVHVLQNLIENAIKHHDQPAGEVVVSARVVDGMMEVRVADDGPGIAPRYHERVFDIFTTLVGRDEREASGVGLSIVRKAVERAGGKVWIESAPPKRGTTFIFTWPLVTEPAGPTTSVPE